MSCLAQASRARARVGWLWGMLALVVVGCLAPPAANAGAVDVPLQTWQPNAPVLTVEPAADGQRVFIGGSFDYVGPRTGAAIRVGQADARQSGAWPSFTGGSVMAIEPDGSGGWFVAGSFTHVDGMARGRLVHVQSSGLLDPLWLPGSGPDSTVWDISVVANAVYASGSFSTVSGEARKGIVRLDATTGAVDPTFVPGAGFDGLASEITVVGGHVYAIGSFSTYAATPRPKIARLDATTAALDTGWPAPGAVDGFVTDIEVAGGQAFVSGSFTTIGGVARTNVAAIDVSDGATSASFLPQANAEVSGLAVDASGVYLAGQFTVVGGVNRNRLARVDAVTGAADAWNPNANGVTSDVVLGPGGVYVLGQGFTTVGGATRKRIARVDPVTGLVDPWNLNVGNAVLAVAATPDGVVVGGQFTSAGGVMRNKVAAISLETGEPTPWNHPGFTSPVTALEEHAGVLYVADGTTVRARNSIDASTAPFTSMTFTGGVINDIVGDGSRIHVGGSFTAPAPGLATLQLNGTTDGWASPINGVVEDLELAPNGQLIAGGSFTYPAPRLMRHLSSGAHDTSWNPDINSGSVSSITTDSTGVWVAGTFTAANGTPVPGLARFGVSTNTLDPSWAPNVAPAISVGAIDLYGGAVALGGTLSSIGGQPRNRAGLVDATSGADTGWNPQLDPVPAKVHDIEAAGSYLVVGSDSGLALFDGTTDSTSPLVKASSIVESAPGAPEDAVYVTTASSVFVRTTGAVKPAFDVRVRAHDRYSRLDPTYAATSGLDAVVWGAVPTTAGTWAGGATVAAGAPRGLVTDCHKVIDLDTATAADYLGRRIDRAIDYAASTRRPDRLPAIPAQLASTLGPYDDASDAMGSYYRLSCAWRGHFVSPMDPLASDLFVRFSGDNSIRANLGGLGSTGNASWPTANLWSGVGTSAVTNVPLAPSTSRLLAVDWGEADGSAEALFEWDDQTNQTTWEPVPEAAFVTKVDYVRRYELADPAGATNGPATVPIGARDRAGNSSSDAITITVDNTPPSAAAAITVPAWSTGSFTVDLPAVTDAGAGVRSVELRRGRQDLAAGSCTGTIAWTPVTGSYAFDGSGDPTELPGSGCYVYQLALTDQVGNPVTTATSSTVKVDTTEAVGGGMTYLAGRVTTPAVTVSWTTPSDPESGVAQTELYRASATLSNTGCGLFSSNATLGLVNPTNPTDDTTIATGYCYRYSLNIVNGAGDARHAVVGPTIEVDQEAPTATWTAPSGFVSGSVPIDPDVTDAASGIGSASVSYSGPAGAAGTICGTGDIDSWAPVPGCSWNTGGVDDGAYLVTLAAVDRAGNVMPPMTTSVTVDNDVPFVSPPTIQEAPDSPYQHVDTAGNRLWINPAGSGGRVQVLADATDAGSGIDYVLFGSPGANWTAPATDTAPSGTATYDAIHEWLPGAATPGPVGVVAYDRASKSSTSSYVVVADTTAPDNGTMSYAGGLQAAASLTFAQGDDGTGSGNRSMSVLRRSAALDPTTQACPVGIGSATWTIVHAPALAATTWNDNTLAANRCYQYALRVTDNVGNVADFVDPQGDVVTTTPAGIVITPTTAASGTATEGGTGASYDVSLRTAPSAQVDVTITHDPQVASATPATFSFTTSNWNQPRTVVVAATDDFVSEATHQGRFMVDLGSPDLDYDQVPIATQVLSIADNDVPGLAVGAPATGVAVGEDGTTANIPVRLESRPTGNVTVGVGHGAQVEVASSTLTFTPDTWNVAQPVKVRAAADADVEGAHSSTVTLTTAPSNATDSGYASISKTVAVSIADDDVAGFQLDGPQDPELSEADPTRVATVRARLTARPTSDVTLNWELAGGQLVASGPLVFTPDNWSTVQVATIRAADDTVAEPPRHGVIGGATTTSADPNFNALPPKLGPVTIIDDDPAAFVTSPGANWQLNADGQLLLDEAATEGSVLRIRAVGDPTSDVVITPVVQPAGQLVVSPTSQTIPAGSHEQVVRFSVRALNDREQELDPHPAKVTWKVTTGDVLYAGAAIPITVARIKDGAPATPRETTEQPTGGGDTTQDTTTTNPPPPAQQTTTDPPPTPGPQPVPDTTPEPDTDAGDDPPGTTVGDDGSTGDEATAGSGTDRATRGTRAKAKARNPARRLKDWASENKGKASVAASAAGTAALWGAKPLALAGKALMSGGGGVPGHPPGLGQLRHLLKKKNRRRMQRFWRGRKRDLNLPDDDDWDDFLWGDRAA